MSDETPFLEAIRRNPADDLARLGYADWLDERGDPRAEYLRLTHEIRRVTTRLAALRPTVPSEWAAAVKPWCDVLLVRYHSGKLIEVVRRVRELTDRGITAVRGDLARLPLTLITGLSLPRRSKWLRSSRTSLRS